MFGKFAEAQKKAEEIKQKLDAITVEGSAVGGKVKVIMNANKKIREIMIADELCEVNRKEELQDMITIAMEAAIENADNVSQSEMRGLLGGLLPGLT